MSHYPLHYPTVHLYSSVEVPDLPPYSILEGDEDVFSIYEPFLAMFRRQRPFLRHFFHYVLHHRCPLLVFGCVNKSLKDAWGIFFQYMTISDKLYTNGLRIEEYKEYPADEVPVDLEPYVYLKHHSVDMPTDILQVALDAIDYAQTVRGIMLEIHRELAYHLPVTSADGEMPLVKLCLNLALSEEIVARMPRIYTGPPLRIQKLDWDGVLMDGTSALVFGSNIETEIDREV